MLFNFFSQVQQSYIKTDQPQYVKTEQEYIKTEQVPALNKDQDIGAFCQVKNCQFRLKVTRLQLVIDKPLMT